MPKDVRLLLQYMTLNIKVRIVSVGIAVQITSVNDTHFMFGDASDIVLCS